MDTCTNCGATLRPGAKFCTTCGTRLNEPVPTDQGWGSSPSQPGQDSGETSVMESVRSSEAPREEPSSGSDDPGHSWSSAYASSESASLDDPASKFVSALDSEIKEVEDDKLPEDSVSGWGDPAPVFTPPPPSNWTFSSSDDEDTSEDSADSTWQAPSTWSTIESPQETDDEQEADQRQDDDPLVEEPLVIESETVEADFTEVLESDDEHGTDEEPDLAPDDARTRAIELADELRRTIRMMGSGGESDHGAAVMALTEVSMFVGDFSDVRGVIADVKNDPRDIQSLGALAAKVDRIEEVLDEHKSLVDAIETAIRELNG